jgi:hypothetical protein
MTPTIIGLASAVLFSLSGRQANKNMLVLWTVTNVDIVRMGVAAGCSVVQIA